MKRKRKNKSYEEIQAEFFESIEKEFNDGFLSKEQIERGMEWIRESYSIKEEND